MIGPPRYNYQRGRACKKKNHFENLFSKKSHSAKNE